MTCLPQVIAKGQWLHWHSQKSSYNLLAGSALSSELAKEPPDVDTASGAYVLPRTVQFIYSATAAGSKMLSKHASSHLAWYGGGSSGQAGVGENGEKL